MPEEKPVPITSATSENAGVTLRYVLTVIGTIMLSRQVISQEVYDQYVKGIPEIVALILMLTPYFQSLWSKWKGRQRTEALVGAALAMPEGTTKAELVAAVPPPPSIVDKITGAGKLPLPIIILVVLCFAGGAVLIATSCTTNASGPVIIGTEMSQTDARRAMTALLDTRTAVLKAMAEAVTARPNDRAVISAAMAVDRADKAAKPYIDAATAAVDDWSVAAFLAAYNRASTQVETMKARVEDVR